MSAKVNKVDLLLKNASELITFDVLGESSQGGQSAVPEIIINGAVAVKDGVIVDKGPSKELESKYQADSEYDCSGKILTPGLIDPHTHPVFAATREEEFDMRIRGMSYREIAAKGGGIKNSVIKLRKMPEEELYNNARKYINMMMRNGTTTIEAKSGYGLDIENELKMLRIINHLNNELPIDIVPTFLGAHDFPPEYDKNRSAYIDILINEMIPAVKESNLAEFCDIFCEEGYYEIEDTRKILTIAKDAGFKLKLHAEEFVSIGGAELAVELQAFSADHLMAITDNGINEMKKGPTIPVVLPGTTFFLGLNTFAPARKMLDEGLPVALATDFNPGSSMTTSLQMIISIATTHLKLTSLESLAGCTINAAKAIDRDNIIGSISKGKLADIVVWDCPTHKHLGYHFGDNLVSAVFKNGIEVISRSIECV